MSTIDPPSQRELKVTADHEAFMRLVRAIERLATAHERMLNHVQKERQAQDEIASINPQLRQLQRTP